MKLICVMPLVLLFFTHFAYSQSPSTNIAGLEVDGKSVRQKYKVHFLSNKKWIKSKRTASGFQIPQILKNEKYLTVQFVFGNHKLEFSNIHISKFRESWTVGIDNAPFSEEFVSPDEADKTKSVRYIKFSSDDIGTYLVVKVLK